MKKRAAVHNLGCKVNAYETDAMKQILEREGYEIVPFQEQADVYVINTCSVTNIADRKSRQMLHRARKQNPDAIVVAAGCYAQTDAEKLSGDGAVDLILGNNRKQFLAQALREIQKEREKKAQEHGEKHAASSDLIDIGSTREYEPLMISKTEEHIRAFLKIQDGCDQFCSYCLIPYARGRVRSRRLSDILPEVDALAAQGCREMVLTGIHLSSYGMGREDDTSVRLADVIRAVHDRPGVERVRLGSLEPRIITEPVLRELKALEGFCPHFHLSLQSGCNETLRRMNRRYTAEEYREKCEMIRAFWPDAALTTDIITGFPGETEEEFQESAAFVESIHFYETHVFPYSRRKGTRADAMPGQLTEEVRKKRSDVLLSLNKTRMREFEARMIGRKVSVLFEEEKELFGETFVAGHSMEYVPVAVRKSRNAAVSGIACVTPVSFLEPHLLLANF